MNPFVGDERRDDERKPLGRGGALETVVPGVTGVLVDEASAASFADAVTTAMARRFYLRAIRAHAERFGRERFGDEMEALVKAAH